MAIQILLTIDATLRWRPGACDLGMLFQRSFDPAGVGVPFQLRRLADHRLKAVYFVDPMPARTFGLDPVRRMVGAILDAGQEVQLHLNPQWCGGGSPFELTGLAADVQHAMIGEARDLLVAAGAVPTAFRAGGFAADDATLDALAALGLRYDSSHNGCLAPWPSAISLPAGQIAPIVHRGVTEIPVTQIGRGSKSDDVAGGRALRLCDTPLARIGAALAHAEAFAHPVVNIAGQSVGLATRDGRRADPMHVGRFEILCQTLDSARERMPTAWFADLDTVRLDADSRPLPVDMTDEAPAPLLVATPREPEAEPRRSPCPSRRARIA